MCRTIGDIRTPVSAAFALSRGVGATRDWWCAEDRRCGETAQDSDLIVIRDNGDAGKFDAHFEQM
jgi:hypothetical protein